MKTKKTKSSKAEKTSRLARIFSARNMKITGTLLVIVAVGSLVAYFMLRDKVIIRAPLLVLENPRFTFVLGDVKYRLRDDDTWKEAAVGLTLKKGSEIKTGARSLADLTFNSESSIRVAANSHFQVYGLTIRQLGFRLNEGSFYGTFAKLFEDQEMMIITPTSTAAVRGTELGFQLRDVYSRSVQKSFFGTRFGPLVKKQQTTVYALSGITEISNPSMPAEKILLSFQKKISVKEGEPPENPKKMSAGEIQFMRQVLNSIHTEEVLLISNKILFDFGSAKLLPESYKELDSIAGKLGEKKLKIRIDGHTDDIGTAYINQKVSLQRAQAVKDYLATKGVDADRLFTAGFGSSKPIDENNTEEGRARNRRVEFIVIQ